MNLDFASVFACKTDDELLVLAVNRRSLEPDAQSALWDELRRRNLTDPRLRPHPKPDEIPFPANNPAFNTPAKIGFALIVLFFYGTAATFFIGLIRKDVHWKQELLTLLLGFLFIFGPIFAAVAWGTRRALRNSAHVSKRRN